MDRTAPSRPKPALWIAGLFALGCWIGDLVPVPRTHVFFLVSGTAATSLALGILYWGGEPLSLLACTVMLGGALRAVHEQLRSLDAQIRLRPPHEQSTTYTRLEAFGRISSAVTIGTRTTIFTLAADSVRIENDVRRGRVHVRVVVGGEHRERASYRRLGLGLPITVAGRFRLPEPPRNPADPDFGREAVRSGLGGVLYARLPDIRAGPGFPSRIARARHYARRVLDAQIRSLPLRPTSRSITRALLLGDRSGLDDRERDRWARAGLLHLLAISGLHVMMIGMTTYTMLGPILRRTGLGPLPCESIRAFGTLFLLIGYTQLAGSPASAVRATTMGGVLLTGAVLGRGYHPLNALGVAALILLVADPAELFRAGFQLSFCAAGGILTMTVPAMRAMERWRGHYPGLLFQLVLVSVVATVATAAITVAHFGYVTFAGVVLNVLAVPATSLVLGLVLIMVALGTIGGFGAAAPAAWIDVLVALLSVLSRWGDTALTSLLLVWLPGTTSYVLALAIGGLAFLVPTRFYRILVAGVAVGVGLVGPTGWDRDNWGEELTILFFDTGQGDAVLVETPDGVRLLVDGGPVGFGADAGRRVLIPHFRRSAVGRIDLVAATHGHRDHVGGLEAVLADLHVGAVLHSGQRTASPLVRAVERSASRRNVPWVTVRAGSRIDLGSVVRLYVIAPVFVPSAREDPNRASLVFLLSYGPHRVLLTGDADAYSEEFVVRRYEEMPSSDLVQAPHHGSSTSSSTAFVRWATEDRDSVLVVVSAGRDNTYGLPDEEVVARWRKARGRVRITAREGAVRIGIRAADIRVMPWRSARNRYGIHSPTF